MSLACLAVVLGGAAASMARAGPEAEVAAYIRLLEAKDYAGFLRRSVHPVNLVDMTRRKSLAQVAKEVEPQADELLRQYRLLKGSRPVPLDGGGAFGAKAPAAGRPVRLLLLRDGDRYYSR